MKTLLAKLTSRKFLAALVSAIGTTVATQFGLDPELAAKLVAGIVGTYILGEGVGDAAERLNATPKA